MKQIAPLLLFAFSALLYAFIPVADDPTTAIGAKNILARYRANYVKPPELKKKPTCFSYLHGTIKATIGGKVITETLNKWTIKIINNLNVFLL